MINYINNYNTVKFEFNGIVYLRKFWSTVKGGKIKIYNAYNPSDVLLEFTDPQNVVLNGLTFANADELQDALLDVIFTSDGISGGGGTPNNPDRFTALGSITRLGMQLRFTVGFNWILNTLPYSLPADFITTISPAGTGNYRYDIVIATNSNSFQKIEGTASNSIGSTFIPQTPIGTLLVSVIFVQENDFEDPEPPIVDIDAVKKSEKSYSSIDSFGDLGDYTVLGNQSQFIFRNGGEVQAIDSTLLTEDFEYYKGRKSSWTNLQDTEVEFRHNAGSGISFLFPDEQNYFVQPRETIEFIEQGAKWKMVGYGNINQGGGGGDVTSVNGQTGAVLLDTDSIPEANNLYFTANRTRGTLLTGLSTIVSGTITALDTMLSAFGKLQNSINNIGILLSGKEDISNKVQDLSAPSTDTYLSTLGISNLNKKRSFTISAPDFSIVNSASSFFMGKMLNGTTYQFSNSKATTDVDALTADAPHICITPYKCKVVSVQMFTNSSSFSTNIDIAVIGKPTGAGSSTKYCHATKSGSQFIDASNIVTNVEIPENTLLSVYARTGAIAGTNFGFINIMFEEVI